MTYIVIHPRQEVSNKCVVKIINQHLNNPIDSLEKVSSQPDFCIVEKEEKGSIKIEQIKILQKKLLYSPFNNKFQFGIIKEAQLMTIEAQNALLKTLEECSKNTILILTVNNENSVLQTILSRCTRIYPNGQTHLENLPDFSNEQSYLEKPVYEKITMIEGIIKERKVDEFLESLIKFFRFTHNEKVKRHENNTKESAIIKILIQAKNRIKKNANSKIALEYICFKIDDNWDKHK